MTTTPRVMLLIDADNVSTDVIEQAISRLHAEYGALHVRRAYGTAENAVKHQRLFKRLSVRPMVNLAAGKNSTDIALAVDALDLVISERPDVVVIASSDSDFAPLVSRLREKGCIVRGVGQKGKVGEETPLIYDDFIEFEHRAARRHGAASAAPAAKTTRSRRGAPAVVPNALTTPAAESAKAASDTAAAAEAAPVAKGRARKKAPPKAAAPLPATEPSAGSPAPAKPARKSRAAAAKAPKASRASGADTPAAPTAEPPTAPAAPAAPAPQPAAPRKAARKSTARKTPARGSAARKADVESAGPATPPLPEKVARAFEALPQLAAGERLDVQNAAAVLRRERVFSNADSWPKFFDRYKDWFELTPAERPTHVQRRAPA